MVNRKEGKGKRKKVKEKILQSGISNLSTHQLIDSSTNHSTTLVDTHSHIDMPDFEDLDVIISNAKNAGIEKIVIPSVDRTSFQKVIEISHKYDGVYCALGIHPSEAKGATDEDFEEIVRLINMSNAPLLFAETSAPLEGLCRENRLSIDSREVRIFRCEKRALEKSGGGHYSGEGYNPTKVVAIGECGLDYYWDKSFVEEQKKVFAKQIEIAVALKKPLIVHDREAHHDTLEMLKDVKDVPVIMHCFSGSWEFAKECIKKGFYIALGGVVTFKNAKKVHEIAKNIPLEHLLLETDAPYLTPEPFRGKRNEPAYVKFAAEKIAEIRGCSLEEIAQATTKNANEVFKF